MHFARPLFLWGLLAALVPVVIHLLGRRRARSVPVAVLRFLQRASARASARWRLRRLLLLAARVAALACLALLFAGPGCDERGRSAGPSAWVLLLDTSPSMAAGRSGSSGLDRARAELLRVVDRADPRDRFLLATTLENPSEEDDGWRRGFTADRAGVRRALSRARVQHGPHRADRALERAFRLLEGVEGGQVVLATDLQASAWGDRRVEGAGRAPLRLFDAGLEKPANAWVASVEEADGAVRVKLAASGAPVARHTVRLRLGDGQSLTAFTDGAEVSFHARVPPGLHAGEASVEPGGDLGLDDRLAFAGRGRSKVRVLLVNGDPRGFEIRDELYFVRRALAPGGRLAAGFEVREVRASDLSPADFDSADAAVLANPGTLGAPLGEALRARMEKGLGVVVAAGDRWKPGDAGSSSAPFLAEPLRDALSAPAGERLDAGVFAGAAAPFREREAGDLTAARVWTYWVPETPGRRGAGAGTGGAPAEVLMRLENGAPLLLDRPLGKGRALLLTTTLDKDGSDLCLQPGFVPWLDRLLLHAAGRLKPTVGRQVAAGYPLALPYAGPVEVERPDGFKAAWAPGAPAFVPPAPGVYRVREGGAAARAAPGVEIDAFGAGLDARESDLTRLDRAGLDARLGRGGYDADGEADGGAPRASSSGVGRRDVSGRWAAGLLAALALEGAAAARWRARRAVSLEPPEGEA